MNLQKLLCSMLLLFGFNIIYNQQPIQPQFFPGLPDPNNVQQVRFHNLLVKTNEQATMIKSLKAQSKFLQSKLDQAHEREKNNEQLVTELQNKVTRYEQAINQGKDKIDVLQRDTSHQAQVILDLQKEVREIEERELSRTERPINFRTDYELFRLTDKINRQAKTIIGLKERLESKRISRDEWYAMAEKAQTEMVALGIAKKKDVGIQTKR